MALPPSLLGPVKLTVAWAFPGAAVTAVGAPGTVAGVTAADATDAGPVPTALVAVTVNVYAVPLERPGTTIEVHGTAQLAEILPGLDVAV
jgi:hypothetical protein